MSTIFLQVKIKSLAAEARIIRHREQRLRRFKTKGQEATYRKVGQLSEKQKATWFGLRSHRTMEVRSEARSSLLAYGFLRGVAYLSMEHKAYTKPDWLKVGRMIEKYGPTKLDEKAFKAWQTSLETHNSKAA